MSVPPTCAAPGPAELNLRRALDLLTALRQLGLRHLVLCPGSRSGPLAMAAGLLEERGLGLVTAVDERSAAFFALALGRAEGVPAAVVCTSGSAVAHLLPAVVEADQGTIPLLCLSADRPARLKGCGANQTVNQEAFLAPCCRWFGSGDPGGLHQQPAAAVRALAAEAWRACLAPPCGPVHLNLPLEEPLHADGPALARCRRELAAGWPGAGNGAEPAGHPDTFGARPAQRSVPSQVPMGSWPPQPPSPPSPPPSLPDPSAPGLVVAGPWRGRPQQLAPFRAALAALLERSGWVLLADPLSGLRGDPGLPLVHGYDLILEAPLAALAPPQVLRLGPLPASRRLERWLAGLDAPQWLVSEGDPRRLDPLGRVADRQWAGGLAAFVELLEERGPGPAPQAPGTASQAPPTATANATALIRANTDASPGRAALDLRQRWHHQEASLQAWLDGALPASGPLNEPALARWLDRWLPAEVPVLLANSSPVRDWESFSAGAAGRPVLGFRGASGIDGTLSEACGLAHSRGRAVLVSGDLALLHDSNGWLWGPQLRGRLTVLLIDNGGGGIFEQLPIRPQPEGGFDFERLFAMPQAPDPLALAACHGVPGRRLEHFEALPAALAWALEQPLALLQLRTDRRRDAALRMRLRAEWTACGQAPP